MHLVLSASVHANPWNGKLKRGSKQERNYDYLLSKGGRRGGNLEGGQEVIVDGETGLVHEHASIEFEVECGPGAQLSGPVDLIGALLAVPDLVLRGVGPRLLTEAVHHGVEVAVRQVEEVVDVVVHAPGCLRPSISSILWYSTNCTCKNTTMQVLQI